MAKILDGKVVSNKVAETLAGEIKTLHLRPTLVIVQIGDHKESDTYVSLKKVFGQRIGVNVIHKRYAVHSDEEDIVRDVKQFDDDPHIHGIIVQAPLPKPFNIDHIVAAISQHKDVDGMGKENASLLHKGKSCFVSAAAQATKMILEYYEIPVEGKKVVVVGDSDLVGKPVAELITHSGAHVTVCNAETPDVPSHTKQADILVIAVGKAGLIDNKYVSPGQTIIDIGISVIGKDETTGKSIVAGDVNFDAVKDIVGAITPVPGGVGPVTIAALFSNVVINSR